ncbi:MAG TPA: glycosyltransferase [Candidatus Nanoarchaeia archaeon]|nr:glycosyltransferase [Candidatus Nanoarchaeia archaeon]
MDIIMSAGAVFFLILFLFLLFIFVVILCSFFVKAPKGKKGYSPKVSILIPAYNEEKSIKDCLDSIRNLEYPKGLLEVIVIDDGSADRTARIAKTSGAKVIKARHQGKSAALNLGVEKASHPILFTIDADTVLEKGCLKELVSPLQEGDVGATTGNSQVKNSNTLIGAFQNIEYHYNNLIRLGFSRVFRNGIWFFGALACYRKSALKLIGGFKRDTMAEDMDIALELRKAGFRSVNVAGAIGHTIAPKSVKELYHQRFRWWLGTLQALYKNRSLFSKKSPPSINFLFINQFWWSFYAFISLPLIIYQVKYWMPQEGFLAIFGYLFRWFTLSGPFYVLYKIPDWGISALSIFGVLSGILSAAMILIAIRTFKDRMSPRNLLVIFSYFPYTILLNILIALSIIRYRLRPKRFFIK